jgi:hypothetical protein
MCEINRHPERHHGRADDTRLVLPNARDAAERAAITGPALEAYTVAPIVPVQR